MAHTADLELTAEELRVLGCLIEKERATPDQYPLTTNALRTACNQKSNRDPIVDYGDAAVEQAMLSLRDIGYARSVTGSGRTVKHKQVLDEALGLSNGEVSILGVLMLRGAQTPNELRTRTERLHGFEDNAAVERTLNDLAGGEPPLVTCIGKASGQREARWVHLLATEPDESSSTPSAAAGGSVPGAHGASPSAAPVVAPAADTPGASPTRPSPDPAAGARPVEPPDPGAAGMAAGARSPEPGGEAGGEGIRIAELESEVEALRSELEALRDRFDDLARQLGVDP